MDALLNRRPMLTFSRELIAEKLLKVTIFFFLMICSYIY